MRRITSGHELSKVKTGSALGMFSQFKTVQDFLASTAVDQVGKNVFITEDANDTTMLQHISPAELRAYAD